MSEDASVFENAVEGLSGVTRAHDRGLSGYEHLRVFEGNLQAEGRSRSVILRTPPSEAVTPDLSDAFLAVARSWRKVATHPNVVEIIEWDADPVPWVLIDNASAETLGAVETPLSHDEVVGVVQDVAEALRNAALYNVSHLDLRPAHVRVSTEDRSAAVDDWGLERAVATRTTDGYCTPYTAPEQLDSSFRATDEQTDVYGLAGLTYFALTGSPPATATRQSILHEARVPPSEVVDSVPKQVDALIMQAFDNDPTVRPNSPFEFATQLQRALGLGQSAAAGGGASGAQAGARVGSETRAGSSVESSSSVGDGTQQPAETRRAEQSRPEPDVAGDRASGSLSANRRRTVLKAGVGLAALGAVGVAASRLFGGDSAPDPAPALQSIPDVSDFVAHTDTQNLLSDPAFQRAISRTLSRRVESLDTTTVSGLLEHFVPGFDLPIEDVQGVIAFGAATDSRDRYAASILQTEWTSGAVREQLTQLDASITREEYRERVLHVIHPSRLPWTFLLSDLGDGEFVVGTRPEIEDVIDIYDGVTEPIDGRVHRAFAATGDGVARVAFGVPSSLVDTGNSRVQGTELLEQIEYGYGSVGTASDRRVTLTVRAVSSSAAEDIESQLEALLVLLRDQIDRTPIVDPDEELSQEIKQLLDAATVERNDSDVSLILPDGVELLSVALPLLFRVNRLDEIFPAG